LNGGNGLGWAIHYLSDLLGFPKGDLMPRSEDTMPRKLIAATELSEFVYCAKAWELKYIHGAEPSCEAQQLQVEGNAWHVAQGRQLARGDGYRWGALIALVLAVILFVFGWLGWAR
jgi:hypothetical protein